MLDKYNEND
jgi:hypothetical protein